MFEKKKKLELDYLKIWSVQDISDELEELLLNLSEKINILLIDDNPSKTTSNVSEWAKKDACWGQMTGMYYKDLSECFDSIFSSELIDSISADNLELEAARKEKVNAELAMQEKINSYDKKYWFSFLEYLESRFDLNFKEKGILNTTQRQKNMLSIKQCHVLNSLLERYGEGFENYRETSKL